MSEVHARFKGYNVVSTTEFTHKGLHVIETITEDSKHLRRIIWVRHPLDLLHIDGKQNYFVHGEYNPEDKKMFDNVRRSVIAEFNKHWGLE